MDNLIYTKGLCGIDEAGRGPFAGPMLVAGVKLNKEINELNDSKKLTEKKREKLYDIIINNSDYHIVISTAKQIDTYGISKCIKNSINEIIANINANHYIMDGNLNYGIDCVSSKIKADGSIQEVAAASILAKVTRDRYMIKISKDYPEYGFHKHKGYGTKMHTQAIKKYGLCDIHRKSFKIKALEI